MIWSLFCALFFISLGAVLVIGGIALVVTVITGPSKVAEYQPEPTDGAPVLGFTQYHGSHGGPYTDERGHRRGLGVEYP